jgi:hypothetical protein
LHDLDKSAIRGAKIGAARPRVPESLPFEFGPLVLQDICGFLDQGKVGLQALSIKGVDFRNWMNSITK